MTYKEWKKLNPDIIQKRKEEKRMAKEKKMLEETPHYEPPYWPVIIAGFPGVGKTYAKEHCAEWGFKVVELDTTPYLWKKNEESGKIQKISGFPGNFYEDLEKILKDGQNTDVILVDAHSAVQKLLMDHHLKFVTVYPRKECKEEYLRRYIRAGKPFAFVDSINENWDSLMEEALERARKGQDILFLGSDKYLDEDTILSIRMNYGALRAAAMVAMESL